MLKKRVFSRRRNVVMELTLLPARRRPQGLVVIGVCLCVCLSVRTVFVRKISQERVHGSPPNLVDWWVGAGGEPLEQVQFWC